MKFNEKLDKALTHALRYDVIEPKDLEEIKVLIEGVPINKGNPVSLTRNKQGIFDYIEITHECPEDGESYPLLKCDTLFWGMLSNDIRMQIILKAMERYG